MSREPDTHSELLVNFLANLTRDEASHGLQKRGSNTEAIRSPDEVKQNPRLEDRAFWTDGLISCMAADTIARRSA